LSYLYIYIDINFYNVGARFVYAWPWYSGYDCHNLTAYPAELFYSEQHGWSDAPI